MDVAGVARAVIAPEDREIAWSNVTGNDRILTMAANSPDRLIPACSINPWSGAGGLTLFRKALDAGAKMLVLAPKLQGFYLTDEITDDLLTLAGELLLPVYIHTGPHGAAAPTQLLLVAWRHPKVQFILGHCGSTDMSYDMSPVFRQAPSNLWYELSFVRPWVVPGYGEFVNPSRLIFGSSAPRNSLSHEIDHFNRHWPIADHPETYGGNLMSLLKEQ
jgi:predicted TIM-barrel fold metal-dependent hydrolase